MLSQNEVDEIRQHTIDHTSSVLDDETKKKYMNMLLACNCCERHDQNHANGFQYPLRQEMLCYCNNYMRTRIETAFEPQPTYEVHSTACLCPCRQLARTIVRMSLTENID